MLRPIPSAITSVDEFIGSLPVDADRFETLLRFLSASPSRRSAVRLLAGLILGSPLALGPAGSGAHDKSSKCKKREGEAKKKCLKKTRKHNVQHRQPGAPPPRSPVAVPTYQCPGPRENNASGTRTARLAQSFTAGVSGSLHQIQIGVHQDAGTTGDYVVELLDLDVDGKPTNTVLAIATVPNATVPVDLFSTVTASFAGPPLVAGIEYAVAISRPEETRTPAFYCHSRSPDDCAGSGFRQDPSTGSSQFVALDQDLVVSVIVLV
jgi:hypothetical protein